MVTYFRVPAFIVSLTSMMIARGFALILAVRYQSGLSGGRLKELPNPFGFRRPTLVGSEIVRLSAFQIRFF